MSDYTENFPNLSTYDFDTIMCQLKQVCGADPSGLINAQFLSRPTTAKDIAQLFYCTYYIMQGSENLQKQYVELYNFVKDFFTNLDLQEEVNNKINQLVSDGILTDLIVNNFKIGSAIYLGNSYCVGTGSTGNNNGLYNRTKDIFRNSYLKWADGCGFNTYSMQKTYTFLSLLQDQVSSMTESEKNSISHIICCSAMGDCRYYKENDYPSDVPLRNALTQIVNYSKANLPNAKVYVVLCDGSINDATGNIDLYAQYFVHNTFKNLQSYIDFSYIGWIGWAITHTSNSFSSDGYHPNDSGYERISSLFKNTIKGHLIYPVRITTINCGNYGNLIGRYVSPEESIYQMENSSAFTISEKTQITNFNELNNLHPINLINTIPIIIKDKNNNLHFCSCNVENNSLYITPLESITTSLGRAIVSQMYFTSENLA